MQALQDSVSWEGNTMGQKDNPVRIHKFSACVVDEFYEQV